MSLKFPAVTSLLLGNGKCLKVRPLSLEDAEDFLLLLSQLTLVQSIAQERFNELLAHCRRCEKQVLLAVLDGMLVGTVSWWIEPKFSRGGSLAAHVEDLVVDKAFRGMGIGKALVDLVTTHVLREHACYKVLLDCSEDKVSFYNQCGFQRSEVHMRRDVN